jgi:outer membrane immunogenic protein
MKKILLALTAAAAFTGSAIAADLPARTYSKSPAPMAVAPSWTGFYIFGGGGFGIWDAESNTVATATGTVLANSHNRVGGDGYFGTVGAGYDWQFNQSWVAGIFADGQFGSLRGTMADPFNGVSGDVKNRTNAAAGVRVGYLVAPNVLSYINGGYSYAEFSAATLFTQGGLPITTTPGFHRNGWFLGGGVENNLNFFGISAPGWFMKTEYRVAQYERATLIESFFATGAPTGFSLTFKPLVQTVSTSLVYRFNWGGPVVARY